MEGNRACKGAVPLLVTGGLGVTQPTKLLPYQFETIEGDLVFKEGATHELRPNKPAAGPGDAVRVRGADAATGSNANGGDALLAGGLGDGTGKKGLPQSEAPLALKKSTLGPYRPLGATENFVFAGDDAGDTELFAATPNGNVQITKDGFLDVASTPQPAVDASLAVEFFSSILGGPGDPTPVNVGQFKALAFPAGATRAVRAQAILPADFRADPVADTVQIACKYTIAGAGGGNLVRLQTSGSSNNNAEGSVVYDLDVSGTVAGQIVTSPVIRSIPAADVAKLGALAFAIQRNTFGGEFAGDFQLVELLFFFKSKAITAVLSISTDLFVGTTQPNPIPGIMGSYRTVDYPAGTPSEVAASFNIDRRYNAGTDCFLQLVFAMSSAIGGQSVNLVIAGSINNVTAIPPMSVTVFPDNTANSIERTIGLVNIGAGLNPLDSVALKIKRVAGDTHTGMFRLIAANLVMGAAIVTGLANAELDYPCVDKIAGVGPPDTDTETDLGLENDAYQTAIGLVDGQDVTFVYRCRRPSTALSGINAITIPYKISANDGFTKVIVTVRKADGTIIFTSASLVSISRQDYVINGLALSALPAIGERFLVLVRAFVNTGQTTFVGSEITVSYE